MKKKTREIFPIPEVCGRKYAEEAADRHREGGDQYRPENVSVVVEYGETPCFGSAIPGSDTFGKKEMAYRIIVDRLEEVK